MAEAEAAMAEAATMVATMVEAGTPQAEAAARKRGSMGK
tara:strand:- start:1118 stop:1234 length:117 start_codon:yes stop_codon:yes gene_type:complete